MHPIPLNRTNTSLLRLDASYIDTEATGADSRDASGLDLSTSELTAEVLDAMTMKDTSDPKDWLKGVNGVIVDDAHDATDIDDRDANDSSFNFGSLDPDLAALLSPNRASTNDHTMFGLQPSLTYSSSKRSPPPSPSRYQHFSSRMTRTAPLTPPSSNSPPPTAGFFPPSPYGVEAQSSPARRRSASLSKSATSHRPVSLSALPRLARSITANPLRQATDMHVSAPPSPQTSPEVDEHGRRASVDHIRRRQPPSPLSSGAHISKLNQSTNDLYANRPSQPRFITPARRTASYSTASSGGRPSLHHLTTSGSASWDTDSNIPSSRASSSAGAAATSRRRLHYPRQSVDEGRSGGDAERTFLQQRARKRSMSLHQDIGGSPESVSPYQTPAPPTRPSSAMSSRRPAAEWLGPRTAKAFAAAGLLDHDKGARNSASNSPGSRYGSLKGNNEFDPRIQHNPPSRMAFSEASGSTSSWGRSRSASRTLTMSEAGGALADSPTLSTTPRTNFSGGSTAPTSISASSSMTQPPLTATIQTMKEKHSQETEALLSALSDSQRITKMLREENSELRTRIQELENAMNQMRRRSASPQPPARSLSRMVHHRISQPHIENGLPKRPQSRLQSQYLHPNDDALPPSATLERDTSPNPFKETASANRRRFSTTSSNFHLPPSNMSMLLHEGDTIDHAGDFSSRSVSPPSPTLIMPKRSSSLRHAHNRSMSSGGNISPTTANFSITGSPGSLHLRPEHEMHLGDMASLDLALVGDDSGDDGF